MRVTSVAPSIVEQRINSPYNTSKAINDISIELKSIAGQAGSVYDFTSMTPKQMTVAMNDLLSSGRMTVDESSSIVGMIPTALSKVYYDGSAPASYGQAKDFISELNLGIKSANSSNDTENAKNRQRSLDALMRSQGAPASFTSINLTA